MARRASKRGQAAIGISAHLGWVAASSVVVRDGGLCVLRTDRLETAAPGDREALEPFHVAGGFKGLSRVPQPDDPKATLRCGLKKQRKHSARALGALLAQLDVTLGSAAILVSRGRSAASFEKSIASHTQIHIEEGNAVRESLRLALTDAGATVHDIDAKTIVSIAARELGKTEKSLLVELNTLRPESDSPWRKEEKHAALAAWIALTRC